MTREDWIEASLETIEVILNGTMTRQMALLKERVATLKKALKEGVTPEEAEELGTINYLRDELEALEYSIYRAKKRMDEAYEDNNFGGLLRKE